MRMPAVIALRGGGIDQAVADACRVPDEQSHAALADDIDPGAVQIEVVDPVIARQQLDMAARLRLQRADQVLAVLVAETEAAAFPDLDAAVGVRAGGADHGIVVDILVAQVERKLGNEQRRAQVRIGRAILLAAGRVIAIESQVRRIQRAIGIAQYLHRLAEIDIALEREVLQRARKYRVALQRQRGRRQRQHRGKRQRRQQAHCPLLVRHCRSLRCHARIPIVRCTIMA